MNVKSCVFSLRGLFLGLFLLALYPKEANAIRCAVETANAGAPLSHYRVNLFFFEDGERQLFLLTEKNLPVAELQYRELSDGLVIVILGHSIDENHHDPTLPQELFEALRRLKPHARISSLQE